MSRHSYWALIFGCTILASITSQAQDTPRQDRKTPANISTVLSTSPTRLSGSIQLQADTSWPSVPSTMKLTACSGDPSFSDDFSDGDTEGWLGNTDVGAWQVINQQLDVQNSSSTGWTWRLTGNRGWSDYCFSFDFEDLEGGNLAVLLRWAADRSDGYLVHIQETLPGKTGQVIIRKYTNNTAAELKRQDVVLTPYVWHHTEFTLIGSTISCSIDGQQITSYTDIANPYFSGRIGFDISGNPTHHVLFDNVEVLCAVAGSCTPFANASGRIVNALSAQPVEGAQVNLVQNGIVRYQASSRSGGLFDIYGVDAGQYTLSCSVHGFVPATREINLPAYMNSQLTDVTLAPAGCYGNTNLFCDDFENGLKPEWTSSGSCAWQTTGGVLRTTWTSGPKCYQNVGDGSWTDYTLDLDVRTDAGHDRVIGFRQFVAGGYGINIRSAPNNDINFDGPDDHQVVAFPNQNGIWYHVTIKCIGPRIVVSVDGVTKIDYTDPTPVLTGGIYLTAWTGLGTCDISYDNVQVTSLASAQPGLAQYDYIRDRFQDLQIDLFSVPLATVDYNMGASNSFVDNWIRPGQPTPAQLESFQRLLLALKLANAGYRYVPNETDPLTETDLVRGAEETWDLGVKNTSNAILAAAAFLHIFDQVGEEVVGKKLYTKVLRELTKFLFDTIAQLKRFIPDEQVRRTVDLLLPVIKNVTIENIDENSCVSCLLASPAIRVAGDEVAIYGFHIPHTQEHISNAGLWAANSDFSGSLASAQAAYESQWAMIRDATEQCSQTVAAYESKSGAPDAIAKMQQLFDAIVAGKAWQAIKSTLGVLSAIINPKGVYYSVRAAAEAYSTAGVVPEQIGRGTNDIFGHASATPQPTDVVALRNGSYQQNILPPQISAYANQASQLASLLAVADSFAIYQRAESLVAALDALSPVFDGLHTDLTAKADSARIQLSDMDTLFALADSAEVRVQVSALQGCLVALGLQLNPFDTEFNTTAAALLDGTSDVFAQCWVTLDSIQQVTSLVGKAPTLSLSVLSAPNLVMRDSVFQVVLRVENVGSGIASDVFVKALPDSTVRVLTGDSTALADLGTSGYAQVPLSISLNPASDSSTYYKTSSLEVAAYASNGIGALISIPFTAPTYSCCLETTGNVNTVGIVDLSDLSLLVAYLTTSPVPALPCPDEANVNAKGIIDISDLSLLVAYLTANPPPVLPNCP